MTTPSERTRALRQARELVDLILKTDGLPDEIRLRAQGVDRHYPSAQDIERFVSWARDRDARGLGLFFLPEETA